MEKSPFFEQINLCGGCKKETKLSNNFLGGFKTDGGGEGGG